MPIARRIKLIDKYKFVETALDRALEMFVLYITTPEAPISILMVYFTRKPLLAALKQDKALTEMPIKYSNFSDIFLLNLVIKLSDCIKINEYAIKFI